MALRLRVFAVISVIVVLLMYVVPFYALSGTVGPWTLLFWVLMSVAYLAIVYAMLRGER